MVGDNLTDEDSRGGETRAKKKVQSLASAQRAHIVSLAQQCHRNHGGTGTLSFRVGANGALNVSSSASSLNMVVTCLEAAIRKNALPNDAAVSGSLQLP